MRQGLVYYKNELAGQLFQKDDGIFVFTYHERWIQDGSKSSISLTLPKWKVEFQSSTLFPFFFNMIPEGTNKELVCRKKRIEKDDYFGLLLALGSGDTIGAVKVVKSEGNERIENK